MKIAFCFLTVVGLIQAESWVAAPYTLFNKRAAEPQNTRFGFNFGNSNSNNNPTRFFTGNGNLDAGIAGAAVGAGLHYLGTAAFNPCTRGGNRGTSNRIFGNQQTQSGLLGALAGFAASEVIYNSQGRPCRG